MCADQPLQNPRLRWASEDPLRHGLCVLHHGPSPHGRTRLVACLQEWRGVSWSFHRQGTDNPVITPDCTGVVIERDPYSFGSSPHDACRVLGALQVQLESYFCISESPLEMVLVF